MKRKVVGMVLQMLAPLLLVLLREPPLGLSLYIYIFPTNTPRVFQIETTWWKPPFPRRLDVEYTRSVCRVDYKRLFFNFKPTKKVTSRDVQDIPEETEHVKPPKQRSIS